MASMSNSDMFTANSFNDVIMNKYREEHDLIFTMQDFELFIKDDLMNVMKEHRAKPRGNIARFVLAVHSILNYSGFKQAIHNCPLEGLPNYWFQPSDLCYKYHNSEFEGRVTIKFSFCEENVDMVAVSGTVNGADNEEKVHEARFDLMKYAAALIECLHGAIADSSERLLVELWCGVYKDVCFPVLCDLKHIN